MMPAFAALVFLTIPDPKSRPSLMRLDEETRVVYVFGSGEAL